MKNKKRELLAVICIVFILILIGIYFNNYNLLKQPPSETWSKEVEIGTGKGKNSPVLIKESERLLTAYEVEGKLRICETDLNANIIKNVDYDIEEDFLKNIIFLKSSDGYMLIYNSSKAGEGYIEKIILDKDLNLVNREIVKGVEEICQAGDSNVVYVYSNKLDIVNNVTGEIISVPVNKVTSVTASTSIDGIQVCYIENQENVNIFSLKNGVVYEPVLVTALSKSEKVTYGNMSFSSDGKNAYMLIEENFKGEYVRTKLVEFNIDGSEGKVSTLYINGSDYIVNTRGAYSEDGGRFYATMSTELGKKEVKKSIISFVVKDGETCGVEVVTRLRELCILPYIDNEYSAFLSFVEKDVYAINISSTNEEFKTVNNVPRTTEKTTALIYMLQGLMESVSYIIILGFRWIAPILVIGGLVTFFDYSFSDKRKKIVYIAMGAIGVGMKTYTIIDMIYGSYSNMLPSIMAPMVVGITICLLIGLIVYSYGYVVYTEDLEGVFLGKFGVVVLIDSILTLMIFVPLIS